MDYDRMIKEKVQITGRIMGGEELWRMMGDMRTKYAAARNAGASLIRYYQGRGSTLKHRSEYPAVGDVWRPSTEWSARFTVRNTFGMQVVKHKQIVEKARTLDLYFDAVIDRIVAGSKITTTLNKNMVETMEVVDFTINYTTGGFVIKGTVDKSVTVDDDIASTCRLIKPQIDDAINALRFAFGGRVSELATIPVGQELLDYTFGGIIGVLGLDYENMKHIKERFYDRMKMGVSNESSEEFGWSQEAYRVITQEIWDNMIKKPENVDYDMFTERARTEHAKVEYVEMNSSSFDAANTGTKQLMVLKTVSYEGKQLEGEQLRSYVMDNIINAEYWHCNDERSHMLFLDFTVGLTDDEKLTLAKDVRYEQLFRELVSERWNSLF